MAERILVIGSPGTGKSTFAKQLSQKMNVPVFHLDKLFWKNDHETINQEEFIKQIEKVIAENESWIIDGNYRDTFKTSRTCHLVESTTLEMYFECG
ncbi:AAA family ATPase [Staphylococcus simulans]|uniref:AAA family ATPase n=1 Tax=Staphylococcus simulans TaxID=1286 RepID=UPI0021D19BC2|nr:AAA family ATPase [Staphylococcus simulans]UXR38183.1 AAA family ATPase [Staphylococcus simulans]